MTLSNQPTEPQTSDRSETTSDPANGTHITPAQISEQHVSSLLEKLQADSESVALTNQKQVDVRAENQLAVVRLGMATSLFYALRTKHPATAAHGLRVALYCSGWAERMGVTGAELDRIEVAALLHDIGKIGIPDRVLRKPGKLTVDEQLVMDTCADLGVEILRGCTGDVELLDIIRYSNRWYESRRHGDGPSGDALPLGSRMLAIADAFDSMTTEHVYRSALSRDRALLELVQGAGNQFDPNLIVDFGKLLEQHPEMLQGVVVNRWLQQLRPQSSQGFWTGTENQIRDSAQDHILRIETRFNRQLLHTLKDGVAFTDSQGVVTQWNDALEGMTGVSPNAIIGKQWSMSVIKLRDPDQNCDELPECPLQQCFHTGAPVKRSMVIESADDECLSVHVEVAPVRADEPGTYGTVIVVHDLSDKEHLEQRLETLDQKTKTDGLTKVANRAHFDETLEELTAQTSAGGPTFSLVICDIDHFKSVNDVHGHPAADEALKDFAKLLKCHSREGDLVARYGGEEFLLLAVNCDNATAAKRAESIRMGLEKLPIAALDNQCITASFGVTEFQSGDSAETILSRADRALLKAKDNGRNRVVQLGMGKMSEVQTKAPKSGWLEWLTGTGSSGITKADILTPVPMDLVIEKLRGFIADHEAEIISVNENQLSIKLMAVCSQGGRRRVDQRIAMQLKLTLSEPQADQLSNARLRVQGGTNVHIEMEPIRNRDRRRAELDECISQVVASLNSYLMGEVIHRERNG